MAVGQVITDFKPVGGPVEVREQPTQKPIENIGLVPSHKTLNEPPPFDLDKHLYEWTKTRDKEEDSPDDDITETLWPLVRPFLAQGYSAAAALNRGLGVFSEHMASIDEWASKKTGGVLKSVIPWKDIANNYDAYTQHWRERASEVGINFLDELIGESAGGAVPGIAEFVLNVPYSASLGAAEAARQGKSEIAGALVEGAKRGVLGAIFKAMDPLQQYLRAPVMGTVFGIQAAAEGAEPREIAKSFGTGMIYSLTSPGGSMGLNEVREGIRKEIPKVETKIKEAETVPRSMPAETGITVDQLDKNNSLADTVLKRPIIHERDVLEKAKEIKGLKEVPPASGLDAVRQSVLQMSEPAVSLQQLEKTPSLGEYVLKRSEIHEPDVLERAKDISGIKPAELAPNLFKEISLVRETIAGDRPSLSMRAFMKSGGWGKDEVLKAIDKGIEKERLGEKQKKIWQTVQREAEYNLSVLKGEKVPTFEEALAESEAKKAEAKEAEARISGIEPGALEQPAPGLEALRQTEREKEQRGSVQIGKEQPIPKPAFAFEENIEKAYQKSVPIDRPLSWKIKKATENIWHMITREYEFLPKTAEYSQLRFKLKALEKQKGVASHNTAFEIAEEIARLDKESYDLFSRKVVLNDLMTEAQRGHDLPWGFTPDTLRTEMDRLNKAIEMRNIETMREGKGPIIQEAMQNRLKDWDQLRNDYVQAMQDIHFDVEPMMVNENYFRHQVLNYVEMEGLYGTGQKLKTPAGRGFLKRREGTTLDINRDFLIPEELVRAQMRHDIEIARVIKWVDDNMSLHRAIKSQAKAEQVKDWHKLIPEGYVAWQPREGNIFYMADSIPAQLARTLHADKLKEIGIREEDLDPILAVGGRRTEFVVKKEIAEQLDKLVRKKDTGKMIKAVHEVTRAWKVWQLISPRRLIKYNLRNLSGDADAGFVGNPRGFLRAPQAAKELWEVFVNKKEMTPEMSDWFDRGGMDSTLQAQEIESLQDVWLFSRLYEKEDVSLKDIPGRIWKKYWKTARMATDMREAVLRYANYLEYLDQMKQSKAGVPKNFGGSIPEEILALGDIKDRAYWLSNELIGAYDRVSVMGQNMRDYWFPFWSWREVNFRRYIQFAKNAAYNGEFAEKLGKMALDKAREGTFVPTPADLEELRKNLEISKKDVAIAAGKNAAATVFIKSPMIAARVGKFIIIAVGLQSATQVWNHLFFPTEEEDLPEDERAKPHIIFGRDREGNIISFNRMGALGDFLEWFGMEEAPVYARKWMDGEMSLSEIIVDMAKSPLNIFAQNLRPDVKTIGEVIERRKIFPDFFNPTQIRDSWLHVARHLGLENEYIAISGLPSKGYAESLDKFLLYSTDPGQVAYSEIFEAKRRYLQGIGKGAEGFWITPKGNALYNLKLAIRYQDEAALEKYMLEYFELGGSAHGISESLERMHPLAGLSKQDRGMFLATLSEEQQKKLEKALNFYMTTLMAGG
jgi:hypothetical protein